MDFDSRGSEKGLADHTLKNLGNALFFECVWKSYDLFTLQWLANQTQ